jgi:hypothetical protein
MAGPEIPHGHRWILTRIPLGLRSAVAGNSPRICTDMPHCFAGTAAMFMQHVLRFSITFILNATDKPDTNTTLSPILSEMPDAVPGYCPDDRNVVGPKRPCADDQLSEGCAR